MQISLSLWVLVESKVYESHDFEWSEMNRKSMDIFQRLQSEDNVKIAQLFVSNYISFYSEEF